LIENNEIAWNIQFWACFSLTTYLFACWKICQWGWNSPKTSSDCFSILFQFYFRMCDGLFATQLRYNTKEEINMD